MKLCSVTIPEPCPNKHYGQGFCAKHHRRWFRYGNPLHVYQGQSYQRAHSRIQEMRGKASEFLCVECSSQAAQWAYDHTDPAEMFDAKRGIPYSLDVFHYEPMCLTCHTVLDRTYKKAVA